MTCKTRVRFKEENLHNHRDRPILVHNLLLSRGNWDETQLQTWFDDTSVNKILETYIPTSAGPDEKVWMCKKNDQYGVKSGYWLRKDKVNPSISPTKFWKQFWKQNLSPKWKYFYWRLFHGALATRINLGKS